MADLPTNIIVPPPSVRAVVEKTATFVAKQGKTFEDMIMRREKGKAKFSFLLPLDPYHAYYQYRISEEKSKGDAKVVLAGPASGETADGGAGVGAGTDGTGGEGQDEDEDAEEEEEEEVPPERPAKLGFNVRMPTMTAQEADTVRLVALFTALKGQPFLSGLLSRESGNAQFRFLLPGHSLHFYFLAMVDSYRKVTTKDPAVMADLEARTSGSHAHVIGRAKAELYYHRKELQREAEMARLREAATVRSIDWSNFVLAGTVEWEDPKDDDPDAAAAAAAEKATDNTSMDMDMDMDMDTGAGDETEGPAAPPAAPAEAEAAAEPASPDTADVESPAEPEEPEESAAAAAAAADAAGGDTDAVEARAGATAKEGIKIVSDYKPRVAATSGPTKTLYEKCPRCAKMIPSEDFEEHLRIELLDPKWRAQQEHKKEREAASLLVEEEAIAANLKAMAERRRVLRGEAAPPAATSTDDPSAAGGGGLASSLLRAPPGGAVAAGTKAGFVPVPPPPWAQQGGQVPRAEYAAQAAAAAAAAGVNVRTHDRPPPENPPSSKRQKLE